MLESQSLAMLALTFLKNVYFIRRESKIRLVFVNYLRRRWRVRGKGGNGCFIDVDCSRKPWMCLKEANWGQEA